MLWLAGLGAILDVGSFAAEFQFSHHFITRKMPITAAGTGDYGLTALVTFSRISEKKR
jgi:hypothetical protein